MRVYLSGGMEYAADEGRNWRAELQQWLRVELHCTVVNPNEESERFFSTQYPAVNFRELKHTDIAAYSRIAGELVRNDCREIAGHSDFVVCYWDEAAVRGAGTKGELTIARYFGKPVYVVTTTPGPDIPGWVLGCTSRLFTSFPELKAFLLSEYYHT